MKNNQFIFKVLTPFGVKYSSSIEKINFLTNSGYITILKDHSAISGLVKTGKCRISINDIEKNFYHLEGFFSFINNELKFVVDNWDSKQIFNKSLDLISGNKIIIGENEIIKNYHSISGNFGEQKKFIEYEFIKLIKNIK